MAKVRDSDSRVMTTLELNVINRAKAFKRVWDMQDVPRFYRCQELLVSAVERLEDVERAAKRTSCHPKRRKAKP